VRKAVGSAARGAHQRIQQADQQVRLVADLSVGPGDDARFSRHVDSVAGQYVPQVVAVPVSVVDEAMLFGNRDLRRHLLALGRDQHRIEAVPAAVLMVRAAQRALGQRLQALGLEDARRQWDAFAQDPAARRVAADARDDRSVIASPEAEERELCTGVRRARRLSHARWTASSLNESAGDQGLLPAAASSRGAMQRPQVSAASLAVASRLGFDSVDRINARSRLGLAQE
jgi:hypothetical protein